MDCPAFTHYLLKWLALCSLLASALAIHAQTPLPKWIQEKQAEPDLKELAEWSKPTPTERPVSVPLPSSHRAMLSAPVYKDGGSNGMVLAIRNNLHWPDATLVQPMEGRVFVTFDVGSNGKVYDAMIVKSMHPLYDAEALKAVKALGEFKPATDGTGQPITIRFTLPVYFHK